MSIDDDAESSSRDLRKLLGVDHKEKLDLVEILNSLRSKGRISDWIVVNDEEMPGAEARFDPEGPRILLTQTTFDGIVRGHQRSNFSVAHEIGHLADGVTETRNRGGARGRRTGRDEKFADAFAANFLAPAHRINFGPQTTVEELQRRFNLSRPAARRRHEELSRRFRLATRTERALPGVVVDFLKEARDRGFPVKSLPPAAPPADGSPRETNAVEKRTATIAETCSGCGWPELELDGTTGARCPKCRARYDRFQDGDSATGNL